jgi:hypothetical protein
MRKTLLLLFLCSSLSVAQNGTSVLARRGIGELQLMTDTRSRGMGLVSATAASESGISISNPALWSFVNGIRLQGDVTMENESYDRYSTTVRSTQLKAAHVAFPVSDALRLRVVTGFVPLSRAQYKASVRQTDPLGEPLTYEYEGSGGISQFRLGASFEPVSSLYLGAAYQYDFGSINRSATAAYDNSNYYSPEQTRSTSFHGSGVMAGLYYNGIKPVALGLSFSSAIKMGVSDELNVSYPTHDSLMTGSSGTQEIPLRFDAGVSVSLLSNLQAHVEYGFQNWESVQNYEAGNVLYNTSHLGIGLEWRLGSRGTSFVDQMVLRGGFAHYTGYVDGGGGQETTNLLTLGVGIPIIDMNRLDMALEYGWRGTDASLLGKRSLLRLSVSFSIGEFWFIRPPMD